jgi:phosphatidylglycerol---prolipoprotein diacylglyceryl transferase
MLSFLAYLQWNPNREIFTIPYLNFPVYWYSLFFALGFIFGYYIFFNFLKRYLLNFSYLEKSDLKNFELLLTFLKKPDSDECKKIALQLSTLKINLSDSKEKARYSLMEGINKIVLSKITEGSLFRSYLEEVFPNCFYSIREKASYVADKMMLYVVIATILGARIGHLLFYEPPFFYLSHPLEIFKIWEGGLASHGAALAIILALFFLAKKLKNITFKLSFLVLLDLISLPTALAAVFIRIGNFFNQEILGKKTEFFLGVFFSNPADGSIPAVRHPAQLYEALFYLLLFLFLLYLSYKPKIYLKKGKLIGLFLFFTFTSRFFIEFIKERESLLLPESSSLIMGQYLSIPFIILGLIFFFIRFKKNECCFPMTS